MKYPTLNQTSYISHSYVQLIQLQATRKRASCRKSHGKRSERSKLQFIILFLKQWLIVFAECPRFFHKKHNELSFWFLGRKEQTANITFIPCDLSPMGTSLQNFSVVSFYNCTFRILPDCLWRLLWPETFRVGHRFSFQHSVLIFSNFFHGSNFSVHFSPCFFSSSNDFIPNGTDSKNWLDFYLHAASKIYDD